MKLGNYEFKQTCSVCPDRGQRVVLEGDELEDYILDLEDVGKAVVECPECY